VSRTLRAVLAHAFFLQLAAYSVRPTSAYRAIELGVSPGLVGLIAASFAVVPLALAVFIGRWNDRGRQYVSMWLGALIMIGAGIGLLWSSSLAALLWWNAAIGLGHLMSVIGEQGLVARAGDGRLDSAFGTYTFFGTLGQAAAPALLGVIGGAAVMPDTRALIVCYVAACAVMFLVTLLLRGGRSSALPVDRPSSFAEVLRVPHDVRRRMTGAMLVSMLVLAAVDLIQVYLPALGVEREMSAWTVGLLLTLRACATMVSRLGLSRLTERYGRSRLVTTSCVVAGLSIALVAAPVNPVLLGVVLFVAGFALGVGQPVSMSIVAVAAPPGTTSTWLALRLSANRLGQSVIPVGLSALTGSIGTGGIFVVTAAGLLLTGVASRLLISPDP
jgi:MFS family permease